MKKVVTFCFSSRYKQCNWNSQLCRLLTNHTNSSIPQFFGTYHYGVTDSSRPTIQHPQLCQGIPCHAEQRSERQRKSGGSVVSAATSKRTGGLMAQQYFAIILSADSRPNGCEFWCDPGTRYKWLKRLGHDALPTFFDKEG